MNDNILLYGMIFGVFLLAGTVKGVTGMGLPTVAMGLLGLVMPPAFGASLLIIPSMVTNVWQAVTGGMLGQLLRRFWLMFVMITIGTVAGSKFLVSVNPKWSAFGLGLALVVYAVYALFAPSFRIPNRLEKGLSPVIGGITGIVTGLTGVFVMPAVPYFSSLGLQKDELVQVLGLSFTISTMALSIGLWVNGAFAVSQLGLSIVCVIPALLGMMLGTKIRHKISPATFKKCFMVFLILLGLQLMSRIL